MKRQALPQAPTPPLSRSLALPALALSLLAGCLSAQWLTSGAWLWALLGCGVLLCFLLHALNKRVLMALLLCMFALGALRTQACLSPVQPVPDRYQITGYVCGEPTLRGDDRITFTLANVTLDGEPAPGRAYCSLYLNDEPPPALFDGASISFEGRVYLPQGKSGAPHFDFRLWLYQNGMSYGITSSSAALVENTPQTAPVIDGASRARASFRSSLAAVMGSESRLAMAMLLGEREGLSEDESTAFQTLGIAHVMAVSGLHVGLIGGLFLSLLSAFKLRRIVQLPLLTALLAGYCALTGFSAASVRAAIMLVLYTAAKVPARRTDPLVVLGASMIVVLLISPLQAFSAGFALSFCAVAGISLLNPVLLGLSKRIVPIREHASVARMSKPRRALAALGRHIGSPRKLLCLSLSAQVSVLLPTAVFFHRLPLYGALINIVVIPYVGLLVPVYALSLLLSGIPLLGAGIGFVASAMSRLLLWAVSLLSTLPYASLRAPGIPTAALAGGVCIVLALSWRVRACAWRRIAAICLVLALAVTGGLLTRPAQLRYIQLSVGQADAALIMDGNQTIAIDVGDDGTPTLDYLLNEGRDIDALYLTHLHLDHAGGIAQLLSNGIAIRQVYLPVGADKQYLSEDSLALLTLLTDHGIPIAWLSSGDEQRYRDVTVRTLWPEGEHIRTGQDANDLPLALGVSFGGYTIATMSDLSGLYEAYAAISCDVLKVAHHGSSQSTSAAFLDFAHPSAALITCSATSRSLPGEDTLTRIAEHGISLYRTDVCGDITITIKDGRLVLTPYKARLQQ